MCVMYMNLRGMWHEFALDQRMYDRIVPLAGWESLCYVY